MPRGTPPNGERVTISVSMKSNNFTIHKRVLVLLDWPWYFELYVSADATKLYLKGSNTPSEDCLQVPIRVFTEEKYYSCKIYSKLYADKLKKILLWSADASYKLSGRYDTVSRMAVFDLQKAVRVEAMKV
jgi:hypothetical protein